MSDRRPILSLDLDGVVHQYSSPWTDAVTISDGVTDGFFEWALEAQKTFRLAIYSSRSSSPGAIPAMQAWIRREFDAWCDATGRLTVGPLEVEFPASKPPAFLSIDDRALTFNGSWADLDPEALRSFKPWNKKPKLLAAPQPA